MLKLPCDDCFDPVRCLDKDECAHRRASYNFWALMCVLIILAVMYVLWMAR